MHQRIGIVKPEYGITGGFELLLRRLSEELQRDGHAVDWLKVDATTIGRRPFGVSVPDDVWQAQPEFFRYMSLADAFSGLPCGHVDLVISTQPPSFAVDHPRHLALFSHHHRIYYDLSEAYVEAGFADDVEVHAAAERLVRQVDHRYLRGPKYVLATSESVRERLRRFSGLDDNVGVYHAGVGVPAGEAAGERRFDFALCVSRHEFPKRTELFVHAMKLLPDLSGVSVGAGGRLPHVQAVDARLSRLADRADAVDDRELWLCRHDGGVAEAPVEESNVRFVGHVVDDELRRLYREALCVVAPAYLEDYGLTAIEAMQHGKPVIVCKDGGGLVTFVEHGVNGFVVEPTGSAIAEAVGVLRDDPVLARRLGDAARETASAFTWARTMEEIRAGLERVLAA